MDQENSGRHCVTYFVKATAASNLDAALQRKQEITLLLTFNVTLRSRDIIGRTHAGQAYLGLN
jgi:hypothetical protein